MASDVERLEELLGTALRYIAASELYDDFKEYMEDDEVDHITPEEENAYGIDDILESFELEED